MNRNVQFHPPSVLAGLGIAVMEMVTMEEHVLSGLI
jgi:hypothetical protein